MRACKQTRGKAIGVPRLTGIRKDFCEPRTLLQTSAKANSVSANLWGIAKKSAANPQNTYSPHVGCVGPKLLPRSSAKGNPPTSAD